jgi:hypothetical protein
LNTTIRLRYRFYQVKKKAVVQTLLHLQDVKGNPIQKKAIRPSEQPLSLFTTCE